MRSSGVRDDEEKGMEYMTEGHGTPTRKAMLLHENDRLSCLFLMMPVGMLAHSAPISTPCGVCLAAEDEFIATVQD